MICDLSGLTSEPEPGFECVQFSYRQTNKSLLSSGAGCRAVSSPQRILRTRGHSGLLDLDAGNPCSAQSLVTRTEQKCESERLHAWQALPASVAYESVCRTRRFRFWNQHSSYCDDRVYICGSQKVLLPQTCDEKLSIGGLKRQLSELERVDEDLIVLVHSGEELKDDAVPVLCGMDRFNGNGEIFLDLQVLDLLEDHGLTAHFERSCPVIAKRDDGSGIPVPLMASQTVAEVHLRLQQALVLFLEPLDMQGHPVEHLTFRPAADGSLHVHASPSSEAPGNTHSVSARRVEPQPVMWVVLSRQFLEAIPTSIPFEDRILTMMLKSQCFM